MTKKIIYTIITVFFQTFLYCQIITINPNCPKVADTITIIYDASLGNAALNKYKGDIYIHTGVLTNNSQNTGNWFHTKANWNQNLPECKMDLMGNNKYKIKYNIQIFYGIQTNEQVMALAMVFRSADGEIVGRTSTNGDILYYINNCSFNNYVSHILVNNELHIKADSGTYVVRPYTAYIIQLAYFTDNIIKPDTSYSRVLLPQNPTTKLNYTNSNLIFSTDSVEILIQKTPMKVMFIRHGDTLLSENKGYTILSNKPTINFKLNDTEIIYGTGSRAIDINRNDQRLIMYNTAHSDFRYGDTLLNICIPFITSAKGYGLYVESSWSGYWDIGNTNKNELEYGSDGGALSYFFVGGSNYESIINNYSLLTGHQPLPPRWALGYIQSKYGYRNTQEAENIVNSLQSNQFPLDALVLDLYWFGSPQTMGNYSWDYNNFPKPTSMISNFKNKGVKTILITEPYFNQQCTTFNFADKNKYFSYNSSNYTYILDYWIGKCGLLDMTNENAKNWLWSLYKPIIDEGVAGWWTDLGEPEMHPDDMLMQGGESKKIHNVYSLLWQKSLYEKYRQDYPSQRLFNLSRSGYAGMQRFSTHPWSGDVNRSFEGLKAQIPIILGMGVCGVGYMHSDIGGFSGSNQLDDELYTRWIEFGAFAPVMRTHGVNIPTEPTAYSLTTQEIVKKYSLLRYRLLPYNYTLSYENSTKGLPLMRTTDFYDSKNNLLTNLNNQYLWGKNILVAPVLQRGQYSRSVVFPQGKWIDFDENISYNGNSITTINSPMSKLPLYIKAGSFIPMVSNFYSTDIYHTDSLWIKYYPDPSIKKSSFTMYDDDGVTPDANISGQYQLLSFTGKYQYTLDSASIHLAASGNGYNGMPASRQIYFDIQRIVQSPAEVFHNKTKLYPFQSYTQLINSNSEGYYLDNLTQRFYIHIEWNTQQTTDIFFSEPLSINNKIKKSTDNFIVEAIFPNPVNDKLNITLSSVHTENYIITINSLTGQKLINQSFACSNIGKKGVVIDTSVLQSGIYFITVTTQKNSTILKFVKM